MFGRKNGNGDVSDPGEPIDETPEEVPEEVPEGYGWYMIEWWNVNCWHWSRILLASSFEDAAIKAWNNASATLRNNPAPFKVSWIGPDLGAWKKMKIEADLTVTVVE